MATQFVSSILLTLLFVGSPVFSSIQDDFQYIVSIFGGTFDNSWQVFEDMAEGIPPGQTHLRFTAETFPEEIPIFSGDIKTFYLQEYIGGDPNNIVRQKIYAFQINQTIQKIELKFYGFVNPTKFINAQDNPGLFENLTWNDIIYLPGCDATWTRVKPDLFHSAALEKCQIVYNNVSFEIVDTNDLTSNYLTVEERWTYLSNGSLFRAGSPYNLSRVDGPTKTQANQLPSATRKQLNNFNEIIGAFEQALPVALYIDLPNCKKQNVHPKHLSMLNVLQDFGVQAYSIDIDTFEFFNSSVFGPTPYFGFSDAPIVRTSKGDVYMLREGTLNSAGTLAATITWLNPANYEKVLQMVFSCQLQDATKGNSGQVLATSSQISLTPVKSFSQLSQAVQQGMGFRFYVRYMGCQTGPQVNAYAGGFIEGMSMGYDGNVTFSKSKLITNYQGSGYVTDIVSGSISRDGIVTFVASDDYVKTFQRVYIETFVCKMTTSTPGAVDLFAF